MHAYQDKFIFYNFSSCNCINFGGLAVRSLFCLFLSDRLRQVLTVYTSSHFSTGKFAVLSSAESFQNQLFEKKNLSGIPSEFANSLDPGQT